jgi:hypothetical protein
VFSLSRDVGVAEVLHVGVELLVVVELHLAVLVGDDEGLVAGRR